MMLIHAGKGQLPRWIGVCVITTVALSLGCGVRARPTGSASGNRAASDTAGSRRDSQRLPSGFSEIYVFLRATVAGRPSLLLFDSGAGSTVLAMPVVRSLGLAERGRRSTFGLGATAVQAIAHDGVRLRIGDVDVHVPMVLSWSDVELPSLGGERAVGIIGADLLRGRVVEIDWQDEVVYAWDTSKVVAPRASDQVMYLGVVQSLPVLMLRTYARGREDSIAVVVDYGSSASLVLDGSVDAARRVAPLLRDVRARRIIGVGGAVDGPEGRLDSIGIGRHILRSPLVFLDTVGVRTVSLAGAQGLIGTELLRRFSVVLDYPRERAIVRATRRMQSPFCRNASGVCIERPVSGAALRVVFVEPRSPAGRAGLSTGDELISIDGIPVQELADREVDARLDLSGVVHVVELRRGGSANASRPTTTVPSRAARAVRPPMTLIVRWRQ